MKKLIPLLLAVFVSAACAHASTLVRGDIHTTEWGAAGSPYCVQDTVRVAVAETLTISPGVDVLFDVDVPFIVEGVISVKGTEADSVRFLPREAAEWCGIRIRNSDSSSFAYARITGGHADGEWPTKDGGGICLEDRGSRLFMSHCVIKGNSAIRDGGGIAMHAGAAIHLHGCTFQSNRAVRYGAGVAVEMYGFGYLDGCSFTSNEADRGGGVYAAKNSNVSSIRCTFTGNIARGDGGGFYQCSTLPITFLHCVFANNAARKGGAIYSNYDCRNIIINCTFSENHAEWGKTLYCDDMQHTFLINCIAWGDPVDAIRGTAVVSFSDVAGGYEGVGNISADPLFTDPANGDYSLLHDSPCIGAGDPQSPQDPDGTRADMGAIFTTGVSPYHPTPVLGSVPTMTWSADASPYLIKGDTRIPEGATLTIGPGVDVLFDADASFTVEGALIANGTETDSIRFIAGTSDVWKGMLITGAGRGVFAYTRISDGYTRTSGSNPGGNGGGIGASSSADTTLTMTNCVICRNRAEYSGGGIACGGRTRLTQCRISDNHCGHRGGGIISSAAAGAVFEDCMVQWNTSDREGGGLAVSGGTALVTRCIISHNSAGSGGGVIVQYRENVAMTDCVISHNAARYCGGALAVFNGATDVGLTRCIMTGNTANGGGAVAVDNSHFSATNCTITGNQATTDGGALMNGACAFTTLTGCILWGNLPQDIPSVHSGVITATYNTIQTGYVGDGNISANPLFTDAAGGDFSLLSGSPCIDTGNPASPQDPDGSRADMGAIPYGQSTAVDDAQPTQFFLSQNAPNPFNPTTHITYGLPEASPVRLAVFDVTGRLVRVLVEGNQAAGVHTAIWDGTDARGCAAGNGVYMYWLNTPGGQSVRRMLLVR